MAEREINLFVLSEDKKTIGFIKEILAGAIELHFFASAAEAIDKAKSVHPTVMVVDYDLKGLNGLEAFQLLKSNITGLKVIMLSSTNSIPLAVAAAKQGIEEVLRKPLQRASFLAALNKLVEASFAVSTFELPKGDGFEWLCGSSEALNEFIYEAEHALASFKDIILVASPGCDHFGFSQVLHLNGRLPKRKHLSLDLQSFEKEANESHFWTMLQKLLTIKEDSLEVEEDLGGTILLLNFEALEYHFKHSILDFIKNKAKRIGAKKLDKNIRVVVAVSGQSGLASFEGEGFLDSFNILRIPQLRDRKNDLPVILEKYVNKYNRLFSNKIKYIAADALALLFYKEFVGNYQELEDLVAAAVSRSQAGYIGIKELPLNVGDLEKVTLAKLEAQRDFALNLAQKEFDEVLAKAVLSKTDQNIDEAARFLSISKLALQDKLS